MKYRYLTIFAILVLVLLGGYFVFSSRTFPTSCDEGSTFKDNAGREYVSCEIMVRFQDDITLDQAEFLIKSMNLKVKESTYFEGSNYEKSKFITIITPRGKEKSYIEELKKLPQVRSAELNGILYLQ